MKGATSPTSVANATLWTTLDFVLGRGLAFAVMVALARLLTPAEFGTVALLALFVALANQMVEAGFGQALIQQQDLSPRDTSTVFWINIAAAGLLAALLVGATPLIAAFFGLPVLIPLTLIMAASVFIGAFGAVQRALMVREMAFRQLTAVRLAASAVSGGVAVVLALSDFGVYALAAQSLVAAVVASAMLWTLSRWRPRAILSSDSARRLFAFGGYMLASSILEIIYSRAYTVLIGKLQGPAALGHFARAESTTALMAGFVTYPMAQVSLPALSRLNGNRERMAEAMRPTLRTSMLVNAPTTLGLAAVAAPFVRTLYGPQWEPAIPLLQILCLGALFMPIHVLNLQALMALGRSDLFFRLEVLKKVVGIAILVVASWWGPVGVAWGTVIAGLLAVFINTSEAARLIGYGRASQARDVLPSIGSACLMAICVRAVIESLPPMHHALHLAIGSAVGALVYVLSATAFDRTSLRRLMAGLRR